MYKDKRSGGSIMETQRYINLPSTAMRPMPAAMIKGPDGKAYVLVELPNNMLTKRSSKPWFSRSVLLGGSNVINIQSYSDDPSTLWIHTRRGGHKVSLGLSRKKVLYLKKVLNEWLRRHPAEVSKHNEPKVRDESKQKGDETAVRGLLNMGDGDTYKYPSHSANLPPNEPSP